MKVKIKLSNLSDVRSVPHVPPPGFGPALPMNGWVEGEFGGEPGFPDLILVKRAPFPDLLVTKDGKAMVVVERAAKAAGTQQDMANAQAINNRQAGKQ